MSKLRKRNGTTKIGAIAWSRNWGDPKQLPRKEAPCRYIKARIDCTCGFARICPGTIHQLRGRVCLIDHNKGNRDWIINIEFVIPDIWYTRFVSTIYLTSSSYKMWRSRINAQSSISRKVRTIRAPLFLSSYTILATRSSTLFSFRNFFAATAARHLRFGRGRKDIRKGSTLIFFFTKRGIRYRSAHKLDILCNVGEVTMGGEI